MEERPGPVHLELPEDIAGEEVEDVPLVPIHPIEIPVAQPAALDRAAEMILRAERPADHAGRRGQPSAAADLRSCRFRPPHPDPVLHHPDGQGHRCPAAPIFYMGTAALSERDYVHEAVDQADLIIAIGHDTIEEAAVHHGAGMARKVIHRRLHTGQCRAGVFPAMPKSSAMSVPRLELLADRVEGKLPRAGALPRLREGILEPDCGPGHREPLAADAAAPGARRAPGHSRATASSALDNGMYKIWFARNYRTFVANTLLLDNALATMGAGLPSAMMAAMLYSDPPRHGGVR